MTSVSFSITSSTSSSASELEKINSTRDNASASNEQQEADLLKRGIEQMIAPSLSASSVAITADVLDQIFAEAVASTDNGIFFASWRPLSLHTDTENDNRPKESPQSPAIPPPQDHLKLDDPETFVATHVSDTAPPPLPPKPRKFDFFIELPEESSKIGGVTLLGPIFSETAEKNDEENL